MQFPLVSRDRYNESLAREAGLQKKLDQAHDKLMEMVDRVVEMKTTIVEANTPPVPEHEPSFALPKDVMAAISERARPGSPTEALLRRHAEKRLANGEAESKDVANEILAGSNAFTDEGW